jgi:phenylalanyl-tRNA synthetase alpha subunit
VQLLIDWVYSRDLGEWLEMLGAGYMQDHIISLLEGKIPFTDFRRVYNNWQNY